jgi:ketosteroid isomerase-like protein
MTEADYTSAVRLLYDAFRRGDDETCLAFFHQNAEWTSAENFIYADESPYIGVRAIRRLIFERIPHDWDNFTVATSEICGGADVVIATGRLRGIFRTNGASLDAQFVQVFHFNNGRIARCQMYTDTAHFKEVVGGLSLPSAASR